MPVSGSYFPALGIQPAARPADRPDDDRPSASRRVVVLSHAYWRRTSRERADVVGEPDDRQRHSR